MVKRISATGQAPISGINVHHESEYLAAITAKGVRLGSMLGKEFAIPLTSTPEFYVGFVKLITDCTGQIDTSLSRSDPNVVRVLFELELRNRKQIISALHELRTYVDEDTVKFQEPKVSTLRSIDELIQDLATLTDFH